MSALRIHTPYLIAASMLAMLLGAAACRTSQPVASQRVGPVLAPTREPVYAVMYSTRKTKLRGVNPEVGIFITRDDGAHWRHTGWAQGHTFSVMPVPGGTGDTIFAACGNGVMRTTDGGHFWKIVTGWRITEVQDVTVNPGRRHQVFAATPYGLYRSDDNGTGWSLRSDGLASDFVSTVRVDRTHPDRVWAGTQKGLFVSDDAGGHWQATTVTDPVRSIRQSPVNPALWAAGLLNRGVAVSRDGGQTWQYAGGRMDTTTIYECEFDPVRMNVLYAAGWETGVMRSMDLGRSWSAVNDGLGKESMHCLAVSRQHAGTVYAGSLGNGLYVSRDGGDSWKLLTPALFDQGQIWDLYVDGEQ